MPSCLHLPRIHKAIGKNLLRGLHISGTRQSMNASLFPGIQHHEETQCNQTSSHSIHRVGRLRLALSCSHLGFPYSKKHTRDIVPTSTILCGRTASAFVASSNRRFLRVWTHICRQTDAPFTGPRRTTLNSETARPRAPCGTFVRRLAQYSMSARGSPNRSPISSSARTARLEKQTRPDTR